MWYMLPCSRARRAGRSCRAARPWSDTGRPKLTRAPEPGRDHEIAFEITNLHKTTGRTRTTRLGLLNGPSQYSWRQETECPEQDLDAQAARRDGHRAPELPARPHQAG